MNKLIETTAKNLEKHGFTVSCYETAQEASAAIAASVHRKTVGMGGSVTCEQLGLFELLSADNTVFWHWRQPVAEARANSATAQVYITSANGVSVTGEIVNIDGSGNRVSSTLYGHERLIFVVGVNKLEESLEKALWRARNVAAPLNARRLERKTPCAVGELKCHDCKSPERMCRGFCVMTDKMQSIERADVIIINQPLGY